MLHLEVQEQSSVHIWMSDVMINLFTLMCGW